MTKIVCAMQEGQYLSEISEEEMEDAVPICKGSIGEYDRRLQTRCNVEIVFGEQKVPEFDVPDGLTAEEYLDKAL